MITQPAHRIRSIALAITVLAMVAGCASQPPTAQQERHVGPGERAANVALQQIGAPYRYGGTSPSGFDCSGLVQYSYARAGVSVPRTTGQLWSVAAPIDKAKLRAGDVLFFSIKGKVSHVGVYLGEKRFVHAPQSGRQVSVESLESPFYSAAFIRAGRLY